MRTLRHPHSRTLNLILDHHSHRAKARLHFNYMTESTMPWSDHDDQKERCYVAAFPKGLSLEMS